MGHVVPTTHERRVMTRKASARRNTLGHFRMEQRWMQRVTPFITALTMVGSTLSVESRSIMATSSPTTLTSLSSTNVTSMLSAQFGMFTFTSLPYLITD